jgi:hypothetical protein
MARLGFWTAGLWMSAIALLMAPGRANAQAAAPGEAGDAAPGGAGPALSLDEQIRAKLNVSRYELQAIVPQRDRRPQDLRVNVSLGGVPVAILLQPYSLRSPNYRVLVSDGKGGLKQVPSSPERTYRGFIEGRNGSSVAASFVDGKVSMIIDDGVEDWWVQPLSDLAQNHEGDRHVAYRQVDVLPGPWSCGVVAGPVTPHAVLSSPEGPPACIRSADIAFDADFEYYQLCGSTVPAVEADILSIMNSVEFIYRRDCEIAYQITTIIVRDNVTWNDPYSATMYSALLPEFQGYWNTNHTGVVRDVAHLFTGKDIDPGPGGVIGVAYRPGVCHPTDGYGLSQSRFSPTFALRVVVTAHELGHNWNATHCNTDLPCAPGADCGIMCSSATGCTGNVEFEPCSAQTIIDYRDSVSCLGAAGATSTGVERLIPNDSADFDNFGYSVDLSGDLLVGGAPQNLPQSPFKPGAAYAFRLDKLAGTWSQEFKFTLPLGMDTDEDRFGVSVAATSLLGGSAVGDVVVVGAHQDDDFGRNSGAAYVYQKIKGQWTFIQKLTATPDPAPNDLFGFSLAISPNGRVIIVSSHRNDDLFTNSGSAYIYRHDGSTWVFEQKLTAPDPGPNDNFSFSVSVSGTDLEEVAVIGAYADDDLGVDAGAAYIFRRGLKSGWAFEQKLTANDGLTGDQFGLAVTAHSNTTADYVLIGAPMADSGALLNTGAAYLFQSTLAGPGSWNQVQKFVAADSKAQDQFGTAVGLSDFIAIIGDYLDDPLGVNSGSAYLFRNDGLGAWALDAKLVPTDGAAGDQFGISVAAYGERAAIGAWHAETPAVDAGAVYVTTDVVTFKDCNKNGAPDDCEIDLGVTPDCNGNMIPDDCDIADGTSIDCDFNGVPDSCDIADPLNDCNNNGFPDLCDIANGTELDCNHNNIPDSCESPLGPLSDCNNNGEPDICDIGNGTSEDCNANNIPDECDVLDPQNDCNGNFVPDSCDIAQGNSLDCNMNGVPDECESFVLLQGPDCNSNGIPDSCELTGNDCNNNGILDECDITGGKLDCNLNGVPDSCEIAGGAPDCNVNGIPDACELIGNDCNANLIPDECDLASGLAQDCNLNLVPDSCDVASGFSTDGNNNGIPDECDLLKCAADVTGNGMVNIDDLLALINSWGPCSGCPEDVAPPPGGDGVVNIDDLLYLINSWGACAP